MTSLEGANPSGLTGWYDLPELRGARSPNGLVQDRWILSRLDAVTATVNARMAEYEIGEAQRAIYEFLWGEYCDWYIEMAKVRLRSGDESPLKSTGPRAGAHPPPAAPLHALHHRGDMAEPAAPPAH